MALLIFDKKELSSCISTCVRKHDSICPGRIWSPKREEKSNYCSLFELVKCLCACHDNDSEPVNHDQKEWLKRRMSAPIGQPYKPFPPIEIPVRWIERTWV